MDLMTIVINISWLKMKNIEMILECFREETAHLFQRITQHCRPFVFVNN